MIRQSVHFALFLFLACVLCQCVKNNPLQNSVERASTQLQAGLSREYVSQFLLTREVLSGGKICHFQSARGVSISSVKEGDVSFYTTDALLTDLRDPNTQEPVHDWVVVPTSRRSDLKSYYAGYQNFGYGSIVRLSRNMLQASPLGRRQARFFDYSSGQKDSAASGTVIIFRSKDASFGRSLMDGGGRLLFDNEGYLRELEVQDAVIYLRSSRRRQHSEVISPYLFRMTFRRIENDTICESVTLTVHWRLPQNPDAICYAIEPNSMRNPFGQRLESGTTLHFLNTKPFESKGLLSRKEVADDILFYTAEPDMAAWDAVLGPVLTGVREDTGNSNSQLAEQTRSNIAHHVLKNPDGDIAGLKKQLEENRSLQNEIFPQ